MSLHVHRFALAPNKSLLRTGGRWYVVCESMAGMDKLPVISLGEPPGAELSRWATFMGSRLRYTGKNPPIEVLAKYPNWTNA